MASRLMDFGLDSEPAIVPRDDQSWSRKARTSTTLAFGFSSVIQYPEGTTSSSTSLAAKRITAAMFVPNDFSSPIVKTGTLNLPEGFVVRSALIEICRALAALTLAFRSRDVAI